MMIEKPSFDNTLAVPGTPQALRRRDSGSRMGLFLRYLPAAFHMAHTAARTQALTNVLGLLWWVIEPLINLMIFYVVVGIIFNARTENFLAFLFVGLVIWRWMSVCTIQAGSSILESASLMRQVDLPKAMFPVKAILIESHKFLFSFVILLIMLSSILSIKLSASVIYLPLSLAVVFLLILGCGFLLGSLVPFFPDLRLLAGFAFRALFFVSGIMFNPSRVPKDYQIYMTLNPFYQSISQFRQILLDGTSPDLFSILFVGGLGIVLLLIGGTIIFRFDRVYPRVTS